MNEWIKMDVDECREYVTPMVQWYRSIKWWIVLYCVELNWNMWQTLYKTISIVTNTIQNNITCDKHCTKQSHRWQIHTKQSHFWQTLYKTITQMTKTYKTNSLVTNTVQNNHMYDKHTQNNHNCDKDCTKQSHVWQILYKTITQVTNTYKAISIVTHKTFFTSLHTHHSHT